MTTDSKPTMAIFRQVGAGRRRESRMSRYYADVELSDDVAAGQERYGSREMVRTPATGPQAATCLSPGRRCLLEVSGQLTWRTSRQLHARFRRAVDVVGRELRVDLGRVSEVDLAGIAVLLVYARLLPTLGGSLQLSNISPACRELMHEMQLSHLLTSVPSRGDRPERPARQQSPARWRPTA